MYDIKTVEFGRQQQPQQQHHQQTIGNSQPQQQAAKTTASSSGSNSSATKWSPYTTAPSTFFLTSATDYITCSVLTPPVKPSAAATTTTTTATTPLPLHEQKQKQQQQQQHCQKPAEATHMTLLSLRRRRLVQRHACLFSILAAFVFGLVLGVLMPMFGLANVFGSLSALSSSGVTSSSAVLPIASAESTHARLRSSGFVNHSAPVLAARPPSDFPTIYELRAEAVALEGTATMADEAPAEPSDDSVKQHAEGYSVAFIKEQSIDLTAEEVFRNAFHLEQDKSAPDAMIVKKLDAQDGSIKEFRVQRTADGRFRKGPERRLSKPSIAEQVLQPSDPAAAPATIDFVPMERLIMENARDQQNHGIIKEDIYWGDLVERALPQGFSPQDTLAWNKYVATQGVVDRLEPGCGRMQNRLVIFADGTRACARYRQNTDQIQGELFSFYLGQLLNLTNLAPSAPAVINLESRTWSSALADITQSQWKQQRPVVLTRWLPDLEPAGIPQPFQPLERHLNKYDVWNITLGASSAEALQGGSESGTDTGIAAAGAADVADAAPSIQNQKGLLKRLEAASQLAHHHQSTTLESSSASATASATASSASSSAVSSAVLKRLIELAQWSDLIVFDYLIANLDRVVNNLYNFQWNADIMAAPAHNLARQTNSQLLVFLDNESGLLHGYRLLKKYEAYHGLLLDNLCVFRQPTIAALRELRSYGAGRKLRELFEQTTDAEVRDVLPSLPDKSIKILMDRIDRVLGQVQKCRDLLTDR